MRNLLVDRLSDVLDPETGSSVIALGIVRRIEVDGRHVEIELDGQHPLARHFHDEAEAVARDALPAATICVRLVA